MAVVMNGEPLPWRPLRYVCAKCGEYVGSVRRNTDFMTEDDIVWTLRLVRAFPDREDVTRVAQMVDDLAALEDAARREGRLAASVPTFKIKQQISDGDEFDVAFGPNGETRPTEVWPGRAGLVPMCTSKRPSCRGGRRLAPLTLTRVSGDLARALARVDADKPLVVRL